jgi:hypothetical protein
MRKNWTKRPILSFAPHGQTLTPGVKLSVGGEFCPLGDEFHPWGPRDEIEDGGGEKKNDRMTFFQTGEKSSSSWWKTCRRSTTRDRFYEFRPKTFQKIIHYQIFDKFPKETTESEYCLV